MGLELYADIEPLLGFAEETERLYQHYLDILSDRGAETLLDVGCGSGRFLQKAAALPAIRKTVGVDLSETMVARARRRGIEAHCIDVCRLSGRFDTVTAVFDVLNYLSPEALPTFLNCISDRLEKGGFFAADINTLTGFEEVAPGSLIYSDDTRLVAIDAFFENGTLHTTIDDFQTAKNGLYRRRSDTVVQYYHPVERLAEACERLELTTSYPVTLFADLPDKEILIFRKR